MPTRAARYVAWIDRHTRAILLISGLAVVASIALAKFCLPLKADLSYLLPQDAPSVRDAERLAQRMPAKDTMLALIVAPDAETRAAVADEVLTVIRGLDASLVEHIESDDGELRAYVKAHRHLFVPLADLVAARDALAKHVADAKVRANPLFIDLDDPAPAASPNALDDLRAKEREADAKLDRPAYVSADGKTQVIVIRTAFRGTDVEADLRAMGPLQVAAERLEHAHPGVRIGFTGGPAMTVAEHDALTRGILLSSLITFGLVALVLLAYLRSARMLALLTANIIAATLVAFGLAAITVGHLNAATAFLGAIIAGNGINYGILLVARYLEERRGEGGAADAVARALAGTLRPTLVASLGAAIAYAALAATKFRGFADFAWIGGAGMLVCWISSFTLLPALMLRFARGNRRTPSRVFGGAVVRVFGFRRPALVCAISGVVVLGAGAVTYHYATHDPFEYDMTQLRSQAPDARRVRDWLKLSDDTFGRGLAGLAGQTFVAVDDPAQVPAVVAKLRALSAEDPIVGPVGSILDVVPPDQEAKLAVLAELRAQIDEAADVLEGDARDELLSLRPPDGLAVVTARDLPRSIAAKLTERDGSIGRIVAVRPGATFDERDGRDLIAFASAVRHVDLGDGHAVSTAGPSVMFADVLMQIRRDGPLITAIAIIALVIMVLLVVGRTRRAVAVLAATGAGTLAMVAVCALAGLKINFLDFVALPITLGLGIDYAINMADRAATSSGDKAREALRSTGGTVLVCSLTTVIGYASLLVSDNLAIRGFGLASLIGEITCVISAFVVVPAIVALRTERQGVESLTSDQAGFATS